MAERTMRALLCEFLRTFYDKGWVSGTGGGICGPGPAGSLLIAPTGVHKERVQPEDLFEISIDDGVVKASPRGDLRPSECAPIFRAIASGRQAHSTVHSHALSCVLAADLAPEGHLVIEKLEMLKGLPGVSNNDRHLVPVISNTEREADLTGAVRDALADERFTAARAILIRDHGAYIFGTDPWEAKRHAEVYHFLFDAVLARSKR